MSANDTHDARRGQGEWLGILPAWAGRGSGSDGLEHLGFGTFDALHLACAAQAAVNVFLTTDDDSMQITAIQPQKKHDERVNIHVDGEFRLALAASLLFEAALHVGDEISEPRIAELESLDHRWKAREAALNLLSFRARTEAELRQRLLRKGYEADVVEPVVAGLADYGLVDDEGFAKMFVRDRVRLRPRGKRRLVQELRAKGVDRDTAREAIAEVMEAEEVSDVDLAREAAAKWSPRAGEDPQRARRRLYGFLARRGFGSDAVRTVMAEVLAGE